VFRKKHDSAPHETPVKGGVTLRKQVSRLKGQRPEHRLPECFSFSGFNDVRLAFHGRGYGEGIAPSFPILLTQKATSSIQDTVQAQDTFDAAVLIRFTGSCKIFFFGARQNKRGLAKKRNLRYGAPSESMTEDPLSPKVAIVRDSDLLTI
jgi:hypothetical protein